MKKLGIILSMIFLFFSCSSTKNINGREQTFVEYVILNKYSDYEGMSKDDWDNQPSGNFPGLRLIKWFELNEEIDMQRFLTIEEYDSLDDKSKEKYEIIYLDETKCVPYGYQLKEEKR